MGVQNNLNNIYKQFDENINSHIFLIITDDIEQATTDVKNLISHILCANESVKKQIENENYIEMTIIKSNGKDILKDDILYLQSQIKTKPILSDKKFYIIENADLMNDSAANKLLKTIEEPQEGIVGFLIAESPTTILPTIKSRCQIETIYYHKLNNALIYDANEMKIATDIIKIIECAEFKDLIIYKNEKGIKDFIKSNGKSIANIIKDYYNNSCEVEHNSLDSSITEIIKTNNKPQIRIVKAKYMNNVLNKLAKNMNAELLIDKIVIDLKEVKKNANSWCKI